MRYENISTSKLFRHLDRVAGDFRPITADIYLNNFCNNRCSWCVFNRWEREPGAVGMSFEDFKKYSDRLLQLGVQGMILTGGGEPTINRDFDKITAYLEEHHIHYGINTNFNVLKFIKPDYIKISLDGYDEDSYEAIRGVRAYNQTIDNIKAYIEYKRQRSPKTSVGIQKVVTSSEDIERFYEAHKGLDVDYIVYRPVESTLGKYYKHHGTLLDAIHSLEKINELKEKDERVVENYKWNNLSTRFEKCSAHWAQIALNEKGEVIYCCHKPYEVVGHILDDGIIEKYAAAKTNMSMCDIPCRMTAPNIAFDLISNPVKNEQFI